MNTISIDIEVEDEQLRQTLFRTIDVETTATKTDRGEASIETTERGLTLTITAQDVIAARAITNSILRLVQTSVDVANSIIP